VSKKISSAQIEELETILDELPADKAQQVFDFAHYLHQRYTLHPGHGSAEAILQVLEDVGPLKFEKGELDALLEELDAMREMDVTDSDDSPR
jgi:hypothetical protein